MADTVRGDRFGRASVRVRTTAAAVVVVAIALLVGAFVLVTMVRGSLRDGLETQAEQRASALADQIESTGLPAQPGPDADDDDDDDPEDLVWQVTDASGDVVRASQPLREPLPVRDADQVEIADADHDYVVVAEGVRHDGEGYVVSVGVTLEEVDDSTEALVPLLLVGVPLVLLVVGGTTWMVATRALAPVERIRREVEQITGHRLHQRVHEPGSRDESTGSRSP